MGITVLSRLQELEVEPGEIEGLSAGDTEVEDLYRARALLEEWVMYYSEEWLHLALNYLRPVDYYTGNPEALLAERDRKLREATAKRKELNKDTDDLTTISAGSNILA